MNASSHSATPGKAPLATSRKAQVISACLFAALALSGCQSTREQLLAEGYPPAFVDGFEAGCSSGRQAAGTLDEFHKDVPRYLAIPAYAEGWNDGFRQCQAGVENAFEGERREQTEADREWRQHVDQSMAKALRHR